MFDIITVGSATVDAFVHLHKDNRFVKKDKIILPVGGKILLDELKFYVGGGGTNTAVSFSRLGLKVAFLGKLGQGNNSKRIMQVMKDERIDTSLICRENARSGFSVIIDAKGADRTIMTYKGSNDDLNYLDIKKDKMQTRWIYIATMTGKSFKAIERLAGLSETDGIKIAFNPSMYLIEEFGAAALKPIIQRTEILILNLEEAAELTKSKDINKIIKALAAMGPKLIAVTNGKQGAYAYDGKEIYFIKAHNLNVVDTTGAGDAFASAFVAGIIKTEDMEFSLQLALANSESVITHYGAKEKLLRMGEAIKAIKKSKNILTRKKLK